MYRLWQVLITQCVMFHCTNAVQALCYYQAIEYAIRNNIKIVEAGAQGEHKLQRGYVPTKTWSAHWIKDQEFSKAIQNFLDNESQLIDNQKERLDDFLPFKN